MFQFNKDGTDFSDNFDPDFDNPDFFKSDETFCKHNKTTEVVTTQFYTHPPTSLILLADVVSHNLFNLLDSDEFYFMLKHKNHEFNIKESEAPHKKGGGKVYATTKISLKFSGTTDITPLNFFDQLVLSACMTEYEAHHSVLTPNIVYRTLGGTKDPGTELKQKIYDSMKKMTELCVRLNTKDAQKHLFHVKSKGFGAERISQILPATELPVVLNGRPCTAFCITNPSALYEYAKCKGHLSTLLTTNLTVPKTKQTYITIMLRSYIYSRIASIKRSKTAKTILPQTLIQICKFDTSPMFCYNLFQQIKTFLNHLVNNNVIATYSLESSSGDTATTLKNCKRITFT